MKEKEANLVISAQEGDPAAMEELFLMNREKIFGLAFQYVRNHQDAEDLLQEIFFRAFGSLSGFDPGRGASFSTWLYRIGINVSINFLRKKKLELKHRQAEENCMSQPDGCRSNPERQLLSREILESVERCLDELSPRQRMIFILKHFQGLKVREIAETMKCSEGSVKKQLFRAVKRLQGKLAIFFPQGVTS